MFDVQKLREEPSRSTSSEFVEHAAGESAGGTTHTRMHFKQPHHQMISVSLGLLLKLSLGDIRRRAWSGTRSQQRRHQRVRSRAGSGSALALMDEMQQAGVLAGHDQLQRSHRRWGRRAPGGSGTRCWARFGPLVVDGRGDSATYNAAICARRAVRRSWSIVGAGGVSSSPPPAPRTRRRGRRARSWPGTSRAGMALLVVDAHALLLPPSAMTWRSALGLLVGLAVGACSWPTAGRLRVRLERDAISKHALRAASPRLFWARRHPAAPGNAGRDAAPPRCPRRPPRATAAQRARRRAVGAASRALLHEMPPRRAWSGIDARLFHRGL